MAFVKRARLPQAEDSAPIRVSRSWGGAPTFPYSIASALTSFSSTLSILDTPFSSIATP